MSDGNDFYEYLFTSSYNNYDTEPRFANEWNAQQHYRYSDEYANYAYGEDSGFDEGDDNTGHENDEEEGVNTETTETTENEAGNATENKEGPTGDGVNYGDSFIFENPFTTFEEAFDKCNEVAYGLGFHLVKYTYHMEKRPPFKLITCDRYGPYKSNAKNPEKPLRKSATKKIMCRFALKVVKRGLAMWVVVPKCGFHNHSFGEFLEGHRRRAQFNDEQKEFIKQQRKSHVKPGMVRNAFTRLFPDQPAPRLKQIYNENARLSAKDRDGRNSVQYMLHLATEAGYIRDFMVNEETRALERVWFVHPEAAQMFKAWPNVILIDSTYKTNKYGLILVQCVGVTPVGKSFLIGYALIMRESTDGYTWVLRRLESLLEPCVKPTVIVTDHEGGLLAALPHVFPTTPHFLCLWHIYNAVETKATNLRKDGTFGKRIAHGVWKKVVEAKTFDDCQREFGELRRKYAYQPGLITYLETQWWVKIHMFAKCFTNLVIHFGNTSTSRVESAHAQLKMWLGSAELTLDNLWRRADVMMHGQHIEIRRTLEDSISKTLVSNLFQRQLFSMLSGRVSATAITEMEMEFIRGTNLGDDMEGECGCTLWNTHRLLCACMLHNLWVQNKRIHPEDVHEFWSRLAYTKSSHRRCDRNEVMEELFNKVRTSHQSVQRDVIETLFSKLFPENEVVETPEIVDIPRGRPRKSNTRNQSGVEHARRRYKSTSTSTSNDNGGEGPPLEINYNLVSDIEAFGYKDFVPVPNQHGFLDAFDPRGDGHCGFRVVSHARTGDEKNYLQMRRLLLLELKNQVYAIIYYGERDQACRRIKWATYAPCQKPNWMEGLDLFGFATAFNWTVCCLNMSYFNGVHSWFGCSTYLPLRSTPGARAPYGILWILHTGDHWVRVRMNDECAMPPIHNLWKRNRSLDIEYYEFIYKDRLDFWWDYVNRGLLRDPRIS